MQGKVDFFVPGFSKCGTTTLFEMLNQHPDIFIPNAKEPNYFGLSTNVKTLEWYRSLYLPAKIDQLKGDCSTFYTAAASDTKSCQEIYEHNPGAKFIFIARDPVSRVESSYREMHNSSPKYGFDTPFELAEVFCSVPQILDDSAYFSRLKTYLDVFGEDQVLIVLMEDLKRDHQGTARRCYEFLGLSLPDENFENVPHANRGEEKLYDSVLFRRMRNSRVFGSWLAGISISNQDKYARKVGLRKLFTEAVVWDTRAVKLFMDQLQGEVESFCGYVGGTSDLWVKYNKLKKQYIADNNKV